MRIFNKLDVNEEYMNTALSNSAQVGTYLNKFKLRTEIHLVVMVSQQALVSNWQCYISEYAQINQELRHSPKQVFNINNKGLYTEKMLK